jgi:glycosyltransferase involved in cell wall biosynthesis
VILEAMQCGTLVIASNEGAISDIIDNEITGYLVDKNSSEQIVDKILHVSKNRQIIRDIVFSAREKYIRKYTLEVFEENLFFILKTILKK